MINKEIFEFPIIYANTARIGKIATGWGAHTTVGVEANALGLKKVLITTTGLKGTGIVDEIDGILKHHGVSTEIFSEITTNPKDHEVMAGYKVFKETQCDGVVSVGGGSSHDCGKALRAVDANDGKEVTELYGSPGGISPHKAVSKSQIAVNTTAGTGAENTGGAAITNTKGKIKMKGLVLAQGVACAVAINDPLLVRLQPASIAAQTAFDAFTHAFEMYVSSIQSQYSLALAARAITLVSDNIREFAYNRMNHKACEAITWASSLSGGIGLNSGGGQGMVHGIGHGISANWGTHHGLANMVVTVPVSRYNLPSAPERFAEMAHFMGIDTRGMTSIQAGEKWIEEVDRMLKDLGVQTGNLTEQFGVEKDYIPGIIETSVAGLAKRSNPRGYNYDEVVALFESLL